MPYLYLALIFCMFPPSFTRAEIPKLEKNSLIQGIEFHDNEGWVYDEQLGSSIIFEDRINTLDSLCDWYRVTCNKQQNHIIKVDLSHLGISKLTTPFFQLDSLQTLILDNNLLHSLPSKISQLKNLTVLSVASNQLSHLPNEITQLTNLKQLNLNFNLLSNFPESIANLINLETLLLNANQIATLPKSISQLKNLFQLELNNNSTAQKFNTENITSNTLNIVNKIEQRNRIHGIAVSISAERTIEYDNFIELKNNTSQAELLALVEHPNPAVRGYAFWALTEHPDINLLPILLQHLNDNQQVKTLFGCYGIFQKTGDFFIDVATHSSNWFSEQLNTKKLTSSQLLQLDYALINSRHDLNARSLALLRIKPDPSLYSRIRELVIKDKIPAAWVALARYKKEQDIPLILTSPPFHNSYLGTHIFPAIEEFPHADFFPYIKEKLAELLKNDNDQVSINIEDLYAAASSFKNQQALMLISTPLPQNMESHKVQVHLQSRFCAIQKYKTLIYDDFLWSLWEKDNLLSSDTLLYLSEKSPKRALKGVINNLKNITDFYKNNSMNLSCYKESSIDETIPAMIDFALSKNREMTISALNNHIASSTINDYSLTVIIIKKIALIQDRSFVEPLFRLLSFLKKNQYDKSNLFTSVSNILSTYKEKEINQRIAAIANQ